MDIRRTVSITAAVALWGAASLAGVASARIIRLPVVGHAVAQQREARGAGTGLYLNAPPCPESGLLPQISGAPVQFSNCGLPQAPATTLPYPGPMVYWGGHVQTHPREYLVLWGWGQPGAFGARTCAPEPITEGTLTATLGCDPDGAGRYMADFVNQIGGTQWAQVQSQYFQTTPHGSHQYVDESGNLLAGIWVDDANPANLAKTTASAPAGPKNTYTQLAAEATRAAAHFGVSGDGLTNANFIIAQAPAFSDPNALSTGYCAFHDYTLPAAPGNAYYNDPSVGQHIAYTNMPYVTAIQTGGQNDCGADSVNAPPRGNLDDFSLALGHEIQETATDPGAEDIVGNITTGSQSYYGGWYDAVDANENGDKCAYVGMPLTQVLGVPDPTGTRSLPVPGAAGNITGAGGEVFAVQSLWSNAAAGPAGYCAGVASTDLPGPLAGEPPYSASTLANRTQYRIAVRQTASRAPRRSRRRAATRSAHRRRAVAPGPASE